MNLSGATNPTFKVAIKGVGIGGEEMEDMEVYVTVKVWLVWADAGNHPLPRPSCIVKKTKQLTTSIFISL
jgi:hypothetical protein